ncbi:Rhodanese-like protein [Neoconidiobolus thromboides FSU 785]|nr:Rhodanese-like protein [Neoconidiobolus thromboides FSU 785]
MSNLRPLFRNMPRTNIYLSTTSTSKYKIRLNSTKFIPIRNLTITASSLHSTSFSNSTNPVSTPINIQQEYISISFYKFVNLPQLKLSQLRTQLLKDLVQLQVSGRIYIATEGINAQFSCPKKRLKEIENYFKSGIKMGDKNLFGEDVTFNISTLNEKGFSKLHVRVKKQIVATDISPEEYNIEDQPTYLDAEKWHKELTEISEKKDKFYLFDVRNRYESDIGHFEGAILHDVVTFREGMDKLIEDTQGLQKKPIYMYCTGGIRCSKAGSILKSKGFKDVRMLKGGITAYGNYIRQLKEKIEEELVSDKEDKKQVKSLFRGQNFTFDKRRGEPISEEIISKCHQCGTPTSNYTNCINIVCNLLFLQCDACKIKHKGTCGCESCKEPILTREDNIERKSAVHHHTIRVRPELVIGKIVP